MKRTKLIRILSLGISLLTATALFVGCGNDAEKTNDGEKLSGTVSTDGSTSMDEVIGALSEAFMNAHNGVNVTYNPTGSGSGIQAVSEGRCDIGLSSRSLKDEEKKKGLSETVLALDGIAVVVNNKNEVSDLTLEQISKIYTGEIKNWKDVGGADAEIVVIGRDPGSGTRDGFESITESKDKCVYRQELKSTGDVIATVSSNPDAIGYASLSAVSDKIKALTVGGVAASEKTVKDGSYVIQRPFVLVTKDGKELGDTAQAFFDFCFSKDAEQYLSGAGVVPAK